MNYSYIPIRMAKIKNTDNFKCRKDAAQMGLSYVTGGDAKGDTLWKTVWQFLIKWNIHTPYHQAVPFLGIYSREMRTYIHPKLETIQMSFNWWMNKQPVVHPHSGILLGDKTEQTVDPHKNLDESHRHYAEWKKPVSKGYIRNDPTYTAFSKRQDYRDGQQINDCQSGG